MQKDAKLVFHPEQRGGLVLLVMSVDEPVYVWYMYSHKRGLMTLPFLFFKQCGTIFFSHIQDLSRTCVPAHTR